MSDVIDRRKSKTFFIEGIPGEFHAFEALGEYFAYHVQSMRLYPLPQLLGTQLVSAGDKTVVDFPQADAMRRLYPPEQMAEVPELPPYSAETHVKTVCLFLTHACNLHCPYCFERISDKSSSMAFETAQMHIDRAAKESKSLVIWFFGGEPLLEFELLQRIIAYCDTLSSTGVLEHVAYTMSTNGQLLDREKALYLKQHRAAVLISADGCFNEALGCHVGSSCKTYPVQNAQHIRLLGDFSVRATVRASEIGHIQDLYPALKAHGAKEILFSPAIDPEFPLTMDDVLRWRRQLESLTYSNYKESESASACTILPIQDIIEQLSRRRPKPASCNTGNGIVAIDADGQAYPCHRFVSHGNRYSLDCTELPELDATSECAACWCRKLCGGICQYHRIFTDSDTRKAVCALRKIEIELACWAFARLHRSEQTSRINPSCTKHKDPD